MTFPQENPRKNNKRITAAVLVAAVATAGVGTSAIASASSGSPDSASSVQRHQAQVDGSLENVRLGDLADELAELGLELNITPASQAQPDEAQPDEAQPEEPSGDIEPDPFAGMTDAEIDALSDEEFFELLDQAGIDYEEIDGVETDGDLDDNADNDHSHDDEGSDEALVARVNVNGDQIDTSDLSPELADRANQIWQRFAKLIPADQRQMVSQFELLSAEYGGAHVYVSDDDPTKWVLGVGEGLGEDLDYVLIHEFGHLLTLQAKEVAPDPAGGSCPAFEIDEGCALTTSTLNEFVQKFWPQSLRNELAKVQAAESDEEYEQLFSDFYERHRDSFVTDYATTNPVEDLAETFAVFVTTDRPTGSTVADQKIELLWNDADMVALRTQIRANQG